MFRKHLKLCLNFLVLIMLLVIAIAGCSKKEEKCYTCQGYLGTLPQTVSNICGNGPGGEPLVNYYINMGYHCYESKSTSKSSSNINGPEEDFSSQTQLTKTEDSDCPCKKNKNNDDVIK